MNHNYSDQLHIFKGESNDEHPLWTITNLTLEESMNSFIMQLNNAL